MNTHPDLVKLPEFIAFRQTELYQEALLRGWIKDGQIPKIWANGFEAGKANALTEANARADKMEAALKPFADEAKR